MSFQIILLFIIATVNAFFSFFVLINHNKEKIRIFFSFIALSVSLWALNLAFFLKTSNTSIAFLVANIYYLTAAIIPLLFFYFTLFFMKKQEKKFTKIHFLISTPFILLIILLLVDKGFILKELTIDGTEKLVVINEGGYITYMLYFIFFVLLSYYQLLKTYLKTKIKKEKIQLKFIFWGTITSFILAMYPNLFLPLFGEYSFIWLGPLFTLIMVFVIGYAIIRHQLFNVKIAITQLLISTIWFALLIKVLIADNLKEQVSDIGLLIFVIFFGILIIRNVIKEVRTREEIEKLATKLKVANKHLKELDQLKSEFVSIASHQLRSPLTAIKGYTSMLLEGSFGKLPPRARKSIEKVFQSSQSMILLVGDFLNLSRIEQGRMKYEFISFDLKTLIQRTIDSLKPTIEKRGLKLNFKTDKQESYKAQIDVGKIQQVIQNIIDNSVKYTPDGFIEIFLKKENGKILISVSDSGVGITKETLPKLFGKFSRASDAFKTNTSGTGLGLYVAKEMVEAHGGRIWAESPGKNLGSTFFIKLKAE